MHNEQQDGLNVALNKASLQTKENQFPDEKYDQPLNVLEQFSQLNSELLNTQRELAKKNIELTQLAAENARLFQEAQKALRIRNEFLSTITHDLKSPLSAIVGFSELLQRQLTSQEKHDQGKILKEIEHIKLSAFRMSGQVNQILDLARSQMGHALGLELKTFDLVELVRQIVSEQILPPNKGRIELKVPASPLVGRWDQARLERLVENLLSNAIKYNLQGETVTLELKEESDLETNTARAVLIVADKGIGIPAKDLPYIFEPFYRSENIVNRIAGTGIGLSSVRQIVEQHGGTVRVESQEGTGTCFTVSLPLFSES